MSAMDLIDELRVSGADDETILVRYDLEAASPPPGLQIPWGFGYIRWKAFRYLVVGPQKYREEDYFHLPAVDYSDERLDAVRRGCEQILQWRGIGPQLPLEGIGADGFADLLSLFHFRIKKHQVVDEGGGHFLMTMDMQHMVELYELTLFNRASDRVAFGAAFPPVIDSMTMTSRKASAGQESVGYDADSRRATIFFYGTLPEDDVDVGGYDSVTTKFMEEFKGLGGFFSSYSQSGFIEWFVPGTSVRYLGGRLSEPKSEKPDEYLFLTSHDAAFAKIRYSVSHGYESAISFAVAVARILEPARKLRPSAQNEFSARVHTVLSQCRAKLSAEQRGSIPPSAIFDDGAIERVKEMLMAGDITMEQAESMAQGIISDYYRVHRAVTREPNWVVIKEYGDNKTYVDRGSVERDGAFIQASVRYALSPPGVDKRNGQAVKEMLMIEEYDTAASRFRVHRITFVYTDDSLSEPLSAEPTWKMATAGNLETLEFLRGLFVNN